MIFLQEKLDSGCSPHSEWYRDSCFLDQLAPSRKEKKKKAELRQTWYIHYYQILHSDKSLLLARGKVSKERCWELYTNQALPRWTYIRVNGVGKSYSHLTVFARTWLKNNCSSLYCNRHISNNRIIEVQYKTFYPCL